LFQFICNHLPSFSNVPRVGSSLINDSSKHELYLDDSSMMIWFVDTIFDFNSLIFISIGVFFLFLFEAFISLIGILLILLTWFSPKTLPSSPSLYNLLRRKLAFCLNWCEPCDHVVTQPTIKIEIWSRKAKIGLIGVWHNGNLP
jgi:hypothetical protein